MSRRSMKYTTSLRPKSLHRLRKLGHVDLVVGVPCLNSEHTIENVLEQVSQGLANYYGDRRSLIVVSDSGSTDDTREIARRTLLEPWQEKLVSIFRGPRGKGSAVRQICEAADVLDATAVALVDSDLRSIQPRWIEALLRPILTRNHEFVTPLYRRHKLDGTITNHVVYPLVRSLYGKRIRQPIGGEFAFSGDMASYYVNQDVWTTDVARFGIDVWLTVNALVREVSICQTRLGVKIHDPKDPAESLGPMFRQVFSVLSMLVSGTSDTWIDIEGSEDVPTFGEPTDEEPEDVSVNRDRLIQKFQEGFDRFYPLWEDLFSQQTLEGLNKLPDQDAETFRMDPDVWIRVLYEILAQAHTWKSHQFKLINLVSPLYFAQVASWCNECTRLSHEEAEQTLRERSQRFEERKPCFVDRWRGVDASTGDPRPS